MGLKRKVLFAAVFASSCLLSTNVVKADQVDVNAEPNVTQSATDKADTVTATTQEQDSQNAVESNSQTQDAQQSSNAQENQQVQAPQADHVVSDQPIDGVFTTTANNYIPLYYADGSVETNRALAANSDWYADTYHQMASGTNYYRVATNEYANANDGTFKSYVQPYQGDATVVYRTGSSIHLRDMEVVLFMKVTI